MMGVLLTMVLVAVLACPLVVATAVARLYDQAVR